MEAEKILTEIGELSKGFARLEERLTNYITTNEKRTGDLERCVYGDNGSGGLKGQVAKLTQRLDTARAIAAATWTALIGLASVLWGGK